MVAQSALDANRNVLPMQVEHTSLDDGEWPGGVDGVGESFEAVAHHDPDVLDTAVLDLGQNLEPVLGGPHHRCRPTVPGCRVRRRP
jgi:hypothetical protein